MMASTLAWAAVRDAPHFTRFGNSANRIREIPLASLSSVADDDENPPWNTSPRKLQNPNRLYTSIEADFALPEKNSAE
jgi:hypothetical protein